MGCLWSIGGHISLPSYRKRKNYGIERREPMAISPFLTEIAKELNPKIESVEFKGSNTESRACILYSRRAKARGKEVYWIIIAEAEIVRCPSAWLFLLYHEVGHAQQFEEGYDPSKATPEQRQRMEKEANEYAYGKMGILGDRGQIKPKGETCYWCIKTQCNVCLKGWDL